MKKNTLLCMAVLFFTASSIGATNYYVTATGVETNDGLSWAAATVLDKALAQATVDDVIHIGAGTYTPSVQLTGGNSDFDATFEIKNNISLIGGYPPTPTEGATPDAANKTIFNGTLAEDQHAYHVVTVTAPVEANKKVSLTNIDITGGKAAATGTAGIKISSLSYPRDNGGAMCIGGASVELNNCRIYDNTSAFHTPGIYIFGKANLSINNCLFENNRGLGNGASLWAASSTVYVNNTNFTGNQCTGVGAIQLITNTKAYFFNSTIANNVVGSGTTTWNNGAGIYVRDGSELQLVNSTVYGNSANGAAAIVMHTSKPTSLPIKVSVISSTITQNATTVSTTATGGVSALTDGCTIEIYNSIISGNINKEGSTVSPDLGTRGTISKKNSIITDKVYDASGSEIADKAFNVTTMLGALANNGGNTHTCKLLLEDSDNPARTLGMTNSALTTLANSYTPAIPADVILKNQMGENRTNMIGAWTTIDTTTYTSSAVEQTTIVFADKNTLFVSTEPGNLITVYSITGQSVIQTKATSGITSINNLKKGSIYLVKVNNQTVKVVF